MDRQNLNRQYHNTRRNRIVLMVLCVVLLVLVSVVSVFVGSFDLTPKLAWELIMSHVNKNIVLSDDMLRLDKVIVLLRIPRMLLGLAAGICLSVSGVVLQGITRNPLVSPFTIGISSAAAFGASIAIVLGIGIYISSPIGVVINAFIASILCAALVYYIAFKLGMSSSVLVLVGVAVSYLFSALTATVQFIADENQLAAIINWTFGSLNGATWEQVYFVGIVIIICLPILLSQSWKLNVISVSSDDFTKSIGINPTNLRILTGMISILLAAAIISFTGIIGFIGLIAPHIARIIVGNDHRFLIPLSALIGGLLIVIADIIGRILIAPVIIPVGIIISYIGVPLFINLIFLKRKKKWSN